MTAGWLRAAFGAQVGHEDDPERAVRALLDLRELLGEMRAGVATMTAVVNLGGSRPDQQVQGPVLAAAERLREHAAEGLLIVDAATKAATDRQFFYEEYLAGEGWWRLEAARGRTGARHPALARSPLVERDQELRILHDLLDRFLRDRRPLVLSLVSEPGLGKSRLVAELARLVDAAPELIGWRVGHARPYNQGALGPLVEIVKAEAGILDGDDPDTVRRKLTDAAAAAGPAVTAALSTLLGITDAEQLGGAREFLFDGWTRFLGALAQRRPLVVVIEDLQWADGTLLEFLNVLPEQVGRVPLLLVVTGRPELLEDRPMWGGQRNALTLTLSPLSREGTCKLLDALLADRPLPAETRAALLDAAAGNPLYVEEAVRMLAVPGAQPTPATIQQLIAARLATVPEADRRLLHAAAVIGETGYVGQLAAVAQVHHETALAGVRRLEQRDFLHRLRLASVDGEIEYAFRHTLIREVAYGQLLRADRADKHQRAAAWIHGLNPEMGEHAQLLAHHYGKALELAHADGQPTQTLTQRTRQAWRHAGDRAAATGSHAAAARAYTQALALAPDPDRTGLLLTLARSQLADHPALATLRDAHQAAIDAGSPKEAAEAAALLAAHDQLNQDYASKERQRLGLDVTPAALPNVALALLDYAIAALLADQHAQALAAARRLVNRAHAEQRDELAASATHMAGEIRLLTGDPGGLAECEQAAKAMDAAGFRLRNLARYGLARALWWYGDLPASAHVAATAHAAATAGDHPHAHAARWFAGIRVALAYAAGRFDEALEIAGKALAADPPGVRVAAECHLWRGSVHLARGHLDLALADAHATQEAITPLDVRYRQAAHALEGRCLLAAGQRAAATACLDDLLADQTARPAQSCASIDEAILLLDLGYPADALPQVDAAYPAKLRGGGLPPTRWHQAVRALTERDAHRATELLNAIGSTPDQATATARLHPPDDPGGTATRTRGARRGCAA